MAALQPLPELGLHLALAGHSASKHLGKVVAEQQLRIQRHVGGCASMYKKTNKKTKKQKAS